MINRNGAAIKQERSGARMPLLSGILTILCYNHSKDKAHSVYTHRDRICNRDICNMDLCSFRPVSFCSPPVRAVRQFLDILYQYSIIIHED